MKRGKNINTVIVDTAGRLAVDEAMMEEIAAVKRAVKPFSLSKIIRSKRIALRNSTNEY